MTVVHDNECAKESKSQKKIAYVLIHHGSNKNDCGGGETKGYEQDKCKLAVVFTITCRRPHRSLNFLSLSYSRFSSFDRSAFSFLSFFLFVFSFLLTTLESLTHTNACPASLC